MCAQPTPSFINADGCNGIDDAVASTATTSARFVDADDDDDEVAAELNRIKNVGLRRVRKKTFIRSRLWFCCFCLGFESFHQVGGGGGAGGADVVVDEAAIPAGGGGGGNTPADIGGGKNSATKHKNISKQLLKLHPHEPFVRGEMGRGTGRGGDDESGGSSPLLTPKLSAMVGADSDAPLDAIGGGGGSCESAGTEGQSV